MDISLSSANERFLKSQIASGIYETINDAINAAISMAISQISIPSDEISRLRSDIAVGLEDIEAGRVINGIEFMDELIGENENA